MLFNAKMELPFCIWHMRALLEPMQSVKVEMLRQVGCAAKKLYSRV